MYDPAKHGTFGDFDGEADPAIAEAERRERLQAATSNLIADLENEANNRVRKRTPIERRWIADLRQFHGQYDETTAKILADDPDRSAVFINITRPKTRDWSARIGDMLLPNDDKNWGLEPTPVPELTEKAKLAAKEAEAKEAQIVADTDAHNQLVDSGAPQQVLAQSQANLERQASAVQALRQAEQEVTALFDQAERRAALMAREIEDQLAESKYPAACRDIIDDSTKLGPGILKGPLTSTKPRRRWLMQSASQFALVQDQDPRPMFRRVDPWHFFPDPDAATMDDSESTFERHLLSKSGMRRKAKMLGWDKATTAEIIKSGPINTATGDFDWFTQLRMMENQTETSIINRYCVWEYQGPLEREQVITMLECLDECERAAEFRDQTDDGDETPMVIVYFCQGKLLKIEEYFPLDSGESMYSVFSFEKAEASILGAVGVPYLMRHEQAMLNGAVRMMMDNAGLSVGPQIVIDKSQVEPENGNWKLTPRKVWKKKGQDIARDQAPFATYNIPMNQTQLAGIIELTLRFVDMVVSMPTIAQGEQGAHVTQTSSGMSMLFNSANVVFRRVIKNWDDDLTTPTIRRAFDWNMQFNPKDEIKGDMQAVARGSSVLLVREVQSQQLMLIAQNWSTHPIIGPAIKVYEVLRLTLQAMNLMPDQVLCSVEEFEKRLKDMAESEAGQESPDVIRAQASIEVAKISAESRKADSETQMQIARLNRETEILKLIQKEGVDMASIQAMLAGKKLDTEHKERLFAAEAAIEQRNAQEARARGEEPGGSGGYISEGGGVE